MLAADETGRTRRSDSRNDFHDEADPRLRALMVAVQNGDQDACRTLLRLCIPWSERVARRTGVPADAIDDVVQNVLIAVHHGRDHCDPSRPFLPWLRAIARNKSVDWIRHASRRTIREVHAPVAVANCPDPGSYPEGADDCDGTTIRASIDHLSPGQQQAVRLLVLDDLSLDQASAVSGIKKVALKVSLHRALKALRLRCQVTPT